MILIAFGGNLPFCGAAPADTILLAAESVHYFAPIKALSSLYASPAYPDPSEPSFVNACALVETTLGPEALLARLHAVERAFGRRRSRVNAPRTLDLDLIDYEGAIMKADASGGGLVLPHPRLAARPFVLKPIAEIAPTWADPLSGRSVDDLLGALAEDEVNAAQPVGFAR